MSSNEMLVGNEMSEEEKGWMSALEEAAKAEGVSVQRPTLFSLSHSSPWNREQRITGVTVPSTLESVSPSGTAASFWRPSPS